MCCRFAWIYLQAIRWRIWLIDQNFSCILKYYIFTAVQLACLETFGICCRWLHSLRSGFLAALYMKCQTRWEQFCSGMPKYIESIQEATYVKWIKISHSRETEYGSYVFQIWFLSWIKGLKRTSCIEDSIKYQLLTYTFSIFTTVCFPIPFFFSWLTYAIDGNWNKEAINRGAV